MITKLKEGLQGKNKQDNCRLLVGEGCGSASNLLLGPMGHSQL